ncbi:MAG: desulfoferrodoxin FeS4 iron-binding domain-containing protein [Acidimicrobiia bacterium]
MTELKAGVRLRCQACGSECIVTKAGQAELECCGAPLSVAVGPGGPVSRG